MNGVEIRTDFSAFPALGTELKASPSTTSISGNNAAIARAAVDFAVPRVPVINTPPIDGSIALKINARFISSCPTIAENGKCGVVEALFVTSMFIQPLLFLREGPHLPDRPPSTAPASPVPGRSTFRDRQPQVDGRSFREVPREIGRAHV